jgi:hypothetical protein
LYQIIDACPKAQCAQDDYRSALPANQAPILSRFRTVFNGIIARYTSKKQSQVIRHGHLSIKNSTAKPNKGKKAKGDVYTPPDIPLKNHPE